MSRLCRPPKAAESLAAFLLPPACREEVLGDLHERYTSLPRYAADALTTIPLVILSRLRRTADPQVLLMQAFATYLAYVGAARLTDPAAFLPQDSAAWWRLAVPTAMTLLGLSLADVYARPGPRGPLVGILFAVASQALLRKTSFALPIWTLLYGAAASLLLTSALRLLFPPATDQLQGAHIPAGWLKRTGTAFVIPEAGARALKLGIGVSAVAVLGCAIADWAALPRRESVILLVAVWMAYEIRKHS